MNNRLCCRKIDQQLKHKLTVQLDNQPRIWQMQADG
jgi:hypothetical protein